MASTQDNRGTAKFMSVDESEDYGRLPEAHTERMTNSFNLQMELRDSSLLPKMAIGFDDEDQVRFTASPKTTNQSK